MTSKLLNAFAAFSVATVITQMILFGYFLTRGTINGDTLTQVVALMNGIDISGNRLQQVLRQSEDREQPDFDDILDARKMESLDMDMRLRSQNEFRDELSKMLADVRIQRERFDERRKSFDERLEEIKQGAQEEGIKELQRILQSLDAVQAKEQLLTMYEDERIDDVVNIVQAMSTDKRKDILAEFVSKDETTKLADILRRISEGTPTTTLINQARSDL
jgi:Rad3-related DNA helicase